MSGINFLDPVQIKYWPKSLWVKCVILLIKKTKLLLKWKKHLYHCYNSIYWFLHSFAKRLHSILCALVCTVRWTIAYPISLQRISYLRQKVFGLHNNQKPTVTVGYAEIVLWFFFLSATSYGGYSKKAVHTCRTLTNPHSLCTSTFKDPWHENSKFIFFF